MKLSRSVHTALTATLALALAAAGCASTALEEPTPVEPPGMYVGAVDGTDAVIAAAMTPEHTTLYVCGGPASYGALSRWFALDAPLVDGAPAVTLENHGVTLAVARTGAALHGVVTDLLGVAHAFGARPRVEGTLAGLYGVMDEGCRTGVVVTQDSPAGVPVVQGTWCSAHGDFQQVTPILPVQLTVAGLLTVQVARPEGLRALFATPILPARP